MTHVLFDDVDASTLVLTTVADVKVAWTIMRATQGAIKQRQTTRFILHTGAIADRVHVKRVGTTSAQQRFSRVDHKVDTIAANSNMQGDVQAMQFGIPDTWWIHRR
jgi:hypothetical protein